MKEKGKERIHELVRKRYGHAAQEQSTNCCCCTDTDSRERALKEFTFFGYSAEEVKKYYQGSCVGLSCGNPLIFADIRPGETVLDLGSGLGFDCSIAAKKVGEHGKVIGVDMTPDMITKSREYIAKTGHTNIEIRPGKIEKLPIEDGSVDVIISNCVVNLSPDKEKVFQEAYRVLKTGGRLVIADIIATAPLPEGIRNDEEAYVKCIAGATPMDELHDMLRAAGFQDIRIRDIKESKEIMKSWNIDTKVENLIISAIIRATK